MKNKILLFAAACLIIAACKKDFLDVKPDKALTVPNTLADLQALLDDNRDMNAAPYLSVAATDDIYTTDQGYAGAPALIKSAYTWEKDLYQGATVSDWNKPYIQVFYANVVLDELSGSDPDMAKQDQWRVVKGSALFYRALAFYHLSQEFAAPYNDASADQMPGIPIRLTSDVNIKSNRGTLRQTYDQIINDLQEAVPLLPPRASVKTRPIKAAAYALLARVYMIMGKNTEAINAASSSLALKNTLIDYNTLSIASTKPFPIVLPDGNEEVLFYTPLISVSFLSNPSLTSIDTMLYRSYDINDLRKTLFFNKKSDNIILFKGTYTGFAAVFAGVATDEVLLTRAECYARDGKTAEAMKDLNTLLKHRWKTGTFIEFTATSANDALHQILIERRKELVYRNLRWTDLRRLNFDDRFKTTLKRNINSQQLILEPGDKRYVFPIPDDEIRNSGIEQNPR